MRDFPLVGRDENVLGAPRPGDTVGSYTVEGVIGSGGMGVVLLASDPRLHRKVAIKLIRPNLLTTRNHERFVSEARSMARVTHENVVAIYDFGEHRGAPYFVMEYVPGETVEYLLDSFEDRMPLDQVLGIMDQACRGVQAIHDSGTIHGDLKPSNLLVGPRFRVAVTDLGLAEIRQEHKEKPRVVGTPSYISPERATAAIVPSELQTRSDVYALGVIAFELFTGRLPFDAPGHHEMMTKHVFEAPPRPSDVRPDLSPFLDAPVLAALNKDPRARTPTAEAFRKQLAMARESASNSIGGRYILLVDDDPEFRALVATHLKSEFPGVTVTECDGGIAALAAARKQRLTLAVVDLDMPEMNGIEVTAALRSIDPELAVVIVTGTGGAADWQVLQALGARSFFVKPLQPTEFLGTVRQLLNPGPDSRPPWQ